MVDKEFTRSLRIELYKRLPQSSEYVPSRRIEGALEVTEDAVAHEYGTIIVDSEVGNETAGLICNALYGFLSTDKFFKKTKYRLFIWAKKELVLVKALSSAVSVSVKGLRTNLDSMVIEEAESGDCSNFSEIYKPHKMAGQAFLITTEDKVNELAQTGGLIIHNLVILYPGKDESVKKICGRRIPCIPLDV